MILQKYHLWIVVLLAVAAIAAALIPTLRPSPEPVLPPTPDNGFGSVEEAFDIASKIVKEYVSAQGDDPARIDPAFSSTLLSKSKIWTIKGYAFSTKENKKGYEWIVILNYDDMGQWQILAKTITPISREIEPW